MTIAAASKRSRAPARAPEPFVPPAFNVAKLLDLRHRHARHHDDYRRVAELARAARADAARLRHEAAADPSNEAASAMLALPADQLLNIASDELRDAGIDIRTVRRVIDADRRAVALAREADALAATLARSRLMLDNLNHFASRFPGSI